MAGDVWGNAGKAIFSFLDNTFDWGMTTSETDNLKAQILAQQELLKSYENSFSQINNQINSGYTTMRGSDLVKIGLLVGAFVLLVSFIPRGSKNYRR